MLSSGVSEQNPYSTHALSNRVLVQRARPEHEHVLRQQPASCYVRPGQFQPRPHNVIPGLYQ